jgi:hypothetical protein
MKLNKQEREALRMMFGGFCAYCGVLLDGKWHVDHVEAVQRQTRYQRGDGERPGRYVSTGKLWAPENDRSNNLFPACVPCNISKGPVSLEVWREWLQHGAVISQRDNYSAFRHAERFGRIIINPEPLVFWFERYAPETGKEAGE